MQLAVQIRNNEVFTQICIREEIYLAAVSRAGRRELLGVKTWLSTLEIVNLCVFRMRH